jgi:DNA polymerase-1
VTADPISDALLGAGVRPGALVAVALRAGVGLGVATDGGAWAFPADPHAIALVERSLSPRWVLWSQDSAALLVGSGVRVARAWVLAAVHRLLFGGWAAEPGRIWAGAHDLPVDAIPIAGRHDLLSLLEAPGADPEEAVRPDGQLHPDWVGGGWGRSPERLRRWAELALEVAQRQQLLLGQRDRPMAPATARSESAAELLCAELAADGLPFDRAAAEALIEAFVGPRPASEADAAAQRARRDAVVLRHLAPGVEIDLRSSAQIKTLLGRLGIEVADTRAGRLRHVQDRHPVVPAILEWRKAERIATTYGYGWLDQHVSSDGRLRGEWTACDGAAGRMTASAGLHNLPAELRSAVMAEPGFVFVRADLAQVEPRVLAAVSGDQALAAATLEDDLYATVAQQLGVDRPTAKVAVLGAMYGSTTGHGAQALRRLTRAYPVAMRFLDDAARQAEEGRDLITYGGRRVLMGPLRSEGIRESPGVTAARGRYGRNAAIQGAAAELFKAWAVTLRARLVATGATIVLCLHDELLVHAPGELGDEVARRVRACLGEAAGRWAPHSPVRFVAEISQVRRWSEAKEPVAEVDDEPVL